jgi:hypothetical protein
MDTDKKILSGSPLIGSKFVLISVLDSSALICVHLWLTLRFRDSYKAVDCGSAALEPVIGVAAKGDTPREREKGDIANCRGRLLREGGH